MAVGGIPDGIAVSGFSSYKADQDWQAENTWALKLDDISLGMEAPIYAGKGKAVIDNTYDLILLPPTVWTQFTNDVTLISNGVFMCEAEQCFTS